MAFVSEITMILTIDLVTVFDAILTSKQMREKLQCLYENLMPHNFRKTAPLNMICNPKDSTEKN